MKKGLLECGNINDYGSFMDDIAEVTPVTLSWHKIHAYSKKTRRLILDDISGIAKSGQLIAFMGARFV